MVYQTGPSMFPKRTLLHNTLSSHQEKYKSLFFAASSAAWRRKRVTGAAEFVAPGVLKMVVSMFLCCWIMLNNHIVWMCSICGGSINEGTPKSSTLDWDFPWFSLKNHPAMGVPPWLWKAACVPYERCHSLGQQQEKGGLDLIGLWMGYHLNGGVKRWWLLMNFVWRGFEFIDYTARYYPIYWGLEESKNGESQKKSPKQYNQQSHQLDWTGFHMVQWFKATNWIIPDPSDPAWPPGWSLRHKACNAGRGTPERGSKSGALARRRVTLRWRTTRLPVEFTWHVETSCGLEVTYGMRSNVNTKTLLNTINIAQ